MMYEDINDEIQEKLKELANAIERFAVIDNKEYDGKYKSQLRDLYRFIEELV